MLFDEGSQLNTVSLNVLKELQIQPSLLPSPWDVSFPNKQTTALKHYVKDLPLRFYAFH